MLLGGKNMTVLIVLTPVTVGNAKLQVLSIVKAHEHMFFARISYQEVHEDIAIGDCAKRENIVIF